MKSWLDLRAVGLAMLFAVAAALPFMSTSVERRDYYFFDITLTSTSAGTTQLFWNFGGGYGENNSSRQPLKVEPKPVVYRYMMPMGEIKALRFDPIDGGGFFRYSHAQIVDYRGRVVHRFAPTDFKPVQQIASVEPHGDEVHVQTILTATDPVLELQLPAPLVLRSNSLIWLQLGLPIAVPVFVVGLILGAPAVSRRLSAWVQPLAKGILSRPRAAIGCTALIAVAVQCHPVLFQGRSFASPNNGGLMLYGQLPTLPGSGEYMFTNTMSSDTGALLFQHLYYPMAQRDALAQGELPLWNRWSLAGEPLLGQGQSMFGDPFNFITIAANGGAWAWDIRFLIARWLFAACLGGIVWQLTRHLYAALLVTLSSAFIGFYTFRLVHPANFSVCYAPAILWAWTGLIRSTTRRTTAAWLAALVAANGITMTSGTMKEAFMLIAGLNFTGVLLLAFVPDATGRRLRLLTLSAAAGVGLILLTAPGWMSFLVAWKHAMTGYDIPGAQPLPLLQCIGFFDDMFYRQSTVDEIVLAPALNFFLLLGVLWWIATPRFWRSDRAGLALMLAAVPPFALAFGLVPTSVVAKIPFIGNIIHTGNTFSCVLLPIVAALAGCGLRNALSCRDASRTGRTLVTVLILFLGLLAIYLATISGGKKSPFFTGYASALTLTAITMLLALHWAVRHARPGLVWLALTLGLPLLLWRYCQYGETMFNPYAFVPGLRTELHASSPGIETVDAHRRLSDPGRIVGWGNTLYPSYNTALHWEGLYGVDAVRSREYQELALEFGLQRVWNWDSRNLPEDAHRLVPGHDLMNVSLYVADHADPARVYPGVELLSQTTDLDIYASPTVWPRAFFTDRLATYATPREFAQRILQGERRPFAAVQVTQTDLPVLGSDLTTRVVVSAHDYRFTANTTTFVIDAPSPGVAVLAETYFADDFRVTLDGNPTAYFRVNHAFKGVAIPAAGRHEISFAYWPQHFTFALWLAAAGIVWLGLGFVWLTWVGSRPPSTPGIA